MKLESLISRDRFDILLEKRTSDVAGLRYPTLYGKSTPPVKTTFSPVASPENTHFIVQSQLFQENSSTEVVGVALFASERLDKDGISRDNINVV